MAKGLAADAIMPPDKMKPLLVLSKAEPVQAAIGLTREGDGLILLHKKAKPKKVLSMLRVEAGKSKLTLNNATLRFGRAVVDTDYDPGMVRFFINKEAPGNMRVKLIEVVKQVAYQKVEFNVDPSLEDDPEEDERGAADAATPTAARPDAAELTRELTTLARRLPEVPNADPAKAGLVTLATDANAKIKAGSLADAADLIARLRDELREALDAAGVGVGQVVPGQAHPTVVALTGELSALARRIAAVSGDNAALRGLLAKLATSAQDAIKASNLAAAAEALERLREAIAQTEGGAPPRSADQADTEGDAGAKPVPPDGASPDWTAARQAWQDADAAVNVQIGMLRKALRGWAETGDSDVRAHAGALLRIAGKGLDDTIEGHRALVINAVTELGDGTPDMIATSGAKTLAAISAFQSFLAGSRKVAVCDANPFGAPVAIRATFEPALHKMADALAGAAGS